MNSSNDRQEMTKEVLQLMREALAPLASMSGPLLAGSFTRVAPDVGYVLNDGTASDWFKNALRSALEHEAVKAANEAELLVLILRGRVRPA